MTKRINFVFFISLFLYSLYCSLQLGMSWDVLFHYEMGKDRLDYLFSFGMNKVNEITYENSKLYPGVYTTILAFFVQFFPRTYIIESIYFINLCFSILAIVGIYKISKELFNKEIGKLSFFICFFNPIFFGHMSMNSIDPITAFANIWFFYTILKYLKKQQTDKKNKYVILSGLCLGLGVGIRHSFIITLIPIFVFSIFEIFYFKTIINNKFLIKKIFIDSFIVLIIAYFVMVLFWPHTHPNIFILPFKLAIEGLSYSWGPPFMLYNGETILTSEFPKSYILVNLFYKMPEFVILSFAIFILLFFKIEPFMKKILKGFNFKVAAILLIIFFPNFLLFISPYNTYNGLRLFLYIIPFISIIPAILIFFLFKMIKSNVYKFIFLFIAVLQLFLLVNFFSISPFHYTYLNIFAGKYSNNSEKFENDYWGISTKKLISSINENSEILEKSKVKIAICGVEKYAQKKYLNKIKNLNFKIVNVNENYDYIIMNNRVFWDANIDLKNTKKQTCFSKFSGEDIAVVNKRGLILSKITKNINN